MTTNSTTEPPFVIPPITGISESERDKYLLIATFLSGLIIFGVIVAIMHKKCRETIRRSRSWIISKTVRHRPNVSRPSGRPTSIEMSFKNPSSPIFSKEVNPPVMFYLGSSNDSQSSNNLRQNRQRSSGTDHDNDSGISVISGSQNIPMCSLTNQCFKFDRDVNDNVMLTYNPSSISLDPTVRLVKVLAPESPDIETQKNKQKHKQRPTLRRSSTVVDKMNFLSGYVPSSRDEDYTVITLTDDSESEHQPSDKMLKQFKSEGCVNYVNKIPKKQSHISPEGVENPAFYLQNKILSRSLSEFGPLSDDSSQVTSGYHMKRRKFGDYYASDNDSDSKLIAHRAEVHVEPQTTLPKILYEKSHKLKTNNNRPVKYRTYTTPKSIDKESQELYKRVLRDRIQDIIFSDSSASSVKSDQTFVKPTHKKANDLQHSASSQQFCDMYI